MASVEAVTIRFAEYEDEERILKIKVHEDDMKNKEFDDLEDALDDAFEEEEELEDEEEEVADDETTTFMFVAEAEDELIGFAMLSLTDENAEAGLISDIRVAETWRDKNVYQMMYQHIFDFAKREAEIKNIRTTVQKFPEGTTSEEICKRVYIGFEGDVKVLRDTLLSVPGMEDLPLSSVVPYQQRHMRKILHSHDKVGKNILTNGYFFADGDSYTLCKENLADLAEEELNMFVDKNNPIKSLSFSSDFDSDRAAICSIDVNCKDVELIKCHVIKHMQRACNEVDGQIVFMVSATEFEDEIRAFCNGIEGLEEVEKYRECDVWSKVVLSCDEDTG
ncbi:Hypp8450 [Branchiostoma lanceolatum]|uniref:Hypp8450 protein n=1 Tax=Branchiostoma lanceolatum TaxID=7740 RepID=A0A8K0EHA2_BRALA|nr:Hypp8450 [Branchiostoma lanceolatum]